VYQFLSGVAITPQTKFVSLKNPEMLAEFKAALYYLHYSIAAYGWPIYLLMHRSTGCCKLLPSLRYAGAQGSRVHVHIWARCKEMLS